MINNADNLFARPQRLEHPIAGGLLGNEVGRNSGRYGRGDGTAGAIIGLRVPGVEVEDIATTAKTLPDFPGLWAGMLAGQASDAVVHPS